MKTLIAATVLAGSAALASCNGNARRDTGGAGDTAATRDTAAGANSQKVTAQMRDASGKDLGTLMLVEGSGGITAGGRLTGLPPGEHGIHLHTTGKCEGPKFTSAGNHWNPTNRKHGTRNPQGPHLGDMPNITAAADSSASVQVTTPGGTLFGDNSLGDSDGAAMVVHAKPDDYRTDPSGNSGDRIACGVVQ
jgi:superoxide dismutase, Cu-Zn family